MRYIHTNFADFVSEKLTYSKYIEDNIGWDMKGDSIYNLRNPYGNLDMTELGIYVRDSLGLGVEYFQDSDKSYYVFNDGTNTCDVNFREFETQINITMINSGIPGTGFAGKIMEAFKEYSRMKSKPIMVYPVTNPIFWTKCGFVQRESDKHTFDYIP